MNQIEVKAWGILPDSDKKHTLRLRKLLEFCKGKKEIELVFEAGIYHFYPDYAVEKLLYVPNHDGDTILRIAFDLSEFCNFSITGNKTDFIFHTEIIPFYINQSNAITIKGITIDYERPVYSEGTILSVTEKQMMLHIDKEKYPYYTAHGRIYFVGENFCHELDCGCLEMDGERMAPVYMGHDVSYNLDYKGGQTAVFTEISENKIEVTLPEEGHTFLKTSKAGNRLILRHHLRTHPAFYLLHSKDINLNDITVYHSTAMAVIAQFTENISLEHFDVAIHPRKKRVFTAAADGFHFVYCKGKIQIQNCLVENQLDDPINIHGIYGRICEVISDTEILVELVQHQQRGIKLGKIGDRMALIHNETMLPVAESAIKDITMLNKDMMYIQFADKMPLCKGGYVIENKEYVPDVLIEGCTFRNNRGRGLLLTSAGEVVVKRNIFSNAGAAILIEGDSNYWFESGAINHIVIEENQFLNCAYVSDWGSAPIQISPSALKYEDGKRYHKCIEIRNNEFQCFDDRILYARNVEKILFEGNTVTKTDAFPPLSGERIVLDEVLEFIEK